MALNDIMPHRGAWRALGTLLLPLSGLYAGLARLRRQAYNRGWRASHDAGVPVISVGNITTGGTGKTPMVRLLAGWLLKEGCRPAILTRGYGGAGADGVLVLEGGSAPDPSLAGDEPCLLARSLPGVPVLVSPDRAAAARMAVERLSADILVLDDGFQHLRLRRTFDLVLLDASDPLWRNRVIPSGTLREPLPTLAMADALVITRTPDGGPPRPLLELIQLHAPDTPLFTARHEPAGITPLGDGVPGNDDPERSRYLLVSGIGNPESFRRTAEASGLVVVGEKRYADHHRFGLMDLDEVGHLLRTSDGDAVLFTEKDAARLGEQATRLPWPAATLGVMMAVDEAERLRELILEHIGR